MARARKPEKWGEYLGYTWIASVNVVEIPV